MDESVAQGKSQRRYWTADDIRNRIEKSKVVIFSKGSEQKPRCGFSRETLSQLRDLEESVDIIDVCEDSSIVAALRKVAGPKALPLVYVNGDVVSCSDSLPKLLESGELMAKVKEALS